MSEIEHHNEDPASEISQPIKTAESQPEIKLNDEERIRRAEEAARKDSEEMQNARRALENINTPKISAKNETRERVDQEIEGSSGVIKQINGVLGENYGLSSSENKLPKVIKSNKISTPAEYNPANNSIELSDESQIVSGNTMGEEMSHFYRENSRPSNITLRDRLKAWINGNTIIGEKIIDKESNVNDKREHLTNEFFGFLGRRMLHEAMPEEDKLHFFPEGEPRQTDKENTLNYLKSLRKNINVIKELRRAGKISEERYEQEITPRQQKRREHLTHFRGYEFASKVDLNRIANWQKLYSMPDKEVRRRFFTDKPDYSGL